MSDFFSKGFLSLCRVYSIQRQWAHCFVVTDTRLSWEFRFSPQEPLSHSPAFGLWKKKPSVSSFLWEVVLFSVKVRLSSPDVPCSCSHLVFVSFSLCLSRSSESLRHSSVSPLSGGEQGRDPIPGTQLDWVVWEVWVVLLAPLLLTVFFFSLRFSLQLISSCHYRVCSNRENYFFFVSSLTHLFPFSCSSSTQ